MLDEKCVFNAARRFGPTEARRHYLARACDGHPHLLARVEALLRIHDDGDDFLQPPVLDERTDFSLRPADGAGEAIGPYTLLDRLGEGGMGVVYLAEQSHPVRRQVALKVVRPGADTAKVIARFEDEREALALMDHPHIARVLDAGVTPSGRPYFVMELVRGVPITRYCDERRLTICERLALFAQVCRGVQHAHQKGVIHRDLKPSNVLVTEVDGNPVPKIIDFGLAKWTRRTADESTRLTLVGAVVGTPEYMSPEQADVTRLDIDTRADVYSLGVLLFELLTGTTPLDWGRSDRPQVLELLARIREEESPRPSARLGSWPTLSEVAAARGVEPAKLVGLVRGDLDWIVLKCLEKDRGRRYETADALATDVERHLRHEPVEASPPSRSYRLRKFARRHRVGLTTAAGFVLLLLAGVAVSTGLAVRAMDAERKAVAERDRKEAARGQARKALDTLTDEAVERLMARQPQLTEQDRAFLRHVLAMHEEFAREDGDRAAVADARYRVGLIRHKLGEHREAEEAFRGAAALQQQLADEFPNQPDRRRDLARTHRRLAVLLRETGRPADAERHAATAEDGMRKLVDDFPDRPDYRRESAAARTTHGNILMATNRVADAEECHRAAVEMLQPLAAGPTAPPDDRRQLAGCFQNLGAVYHHTNRPDRAEECYQAARKLFQQLADESHGLPDDRRDLAQLLGNLAALYVETQRRPQAEEVFRAAVGAYQQLTDEYPTRPDYRRLLASSHSNLANLLTRMREFTQAEGEYLAAKGGYERLAGDFPLAPEYQADLGRVLAGLALLKSIGKDHDAAAGLLKRALEHDRAALRVEPANPVYREACRTHLAVLAEVYGSKGDHAAATGTADELARFAFDPPDDHFTAAWITVRCVGLAVQDKATADAYADRAMAHLRVAVRHGFKDVTRLKGSRDFDPLRPRDDFGQLLRDLGGRP